MKKSSYLIFFLFGLSLTSCTNSKTKDDKESNSSASQIVEPKADESRTIVAQSEPDTLKGSLKAKAMGSIGNTGIIINYYSPACRGRVIWGGLVPFDNVWVTGAHRATNIDFNQDVVIGGITIPSGKYALFTVPGKDEWTIIINKNWEQHLADDYDQKVDVVRVTVKPDVAAQNQERLMYTVEPDSGDTGAIIIRWEKVRISLTIRSNG